MKLGEAVYKSQQKEAGKQGTQQSKGPENKNKKSKFKHQAGLVMKKLKIW